MSTPPSDGAKGGAWRSWAATFHLLVVTTWLLLAVMLPFDWRPVALRPRRRPT